MKSTIRTLSIVLLGTSLFFSLPAVHADENTNFLKDPSFELQVAPDQGGWTSFKYSKFSSDEAHNGNQAMFNWAFSRTVPFPPFLVGSASGSFQEFPAEPGSRWRLTGYGLTPTVLKKTPAFGILQVSFFDARGKDLGTIETVGDKITRAKISNEINSQTPVDVWIFLDTGIATAPADTATVQAFTLYVDFSGSNRSQGVYFDDLRLCLLEDSKDGKSACDKAD